MYKINKNIPGWNNDRILYELSRFSSQVPKNGNILELGALFGRSTYVLGHNKHPSVKLHVIDIWGNLYLDSFKTVYFHDKKCPTKEQQLIESKFKKDPDRLDREDFYNLWKHYTQDIENIESYRGFTNMSNENFPDFDFIFHDAGHSFEDVYNDLYHWFPKLKNNGIIIVDDYEIVQFPEVVKAVDLFVEEKKLNKQMITERNILITR